MGAERINESRDKFDPLNEPIYAIFYTKYDGTGNPYDAFLSFRRAFFKGGKRTVRMKKKAVLKGYPGEIKGKMTPHSIRWKVRMGSIDTEHTYDTKNGYTLVKRGYNNTLISRIYFDKNHEWQKSEYFKPANLDPSKPQVVLSPIEWRSKMEIRELNAKTDLYRIRTLYPSSYFNSSPSQNVVDSIYGKPTLVIYSESGVYCYCTEENMVQRQNAMEEINQSHIFMSSSWPTEEGELQPEDKTEDPSVVLFKDMQHAAEVLPLDEDESPVQEEASDLEVQPPDESEEIEVQQDDQFEEKPKLDNLIIDSSMEGSKEMTDEKTLPAEDPAEELPDSCREDNSSKPVPEANAEEITGTGAVMDDLTLEETQQEEVSVAPVSEADFLEAESAEPANSKGDLNPDKPEEEAFAEASSLEYMASQADHKPPEDTNSIDVNELMEEPELPLPEPEKFLSALETTDIAVESAFSGDFEYPEDVTVNSSMTADEVLDVHTAAEDDLKMPEVTSSLSDMHNKPKYENWEDGHVRIEQDGITAYEGGYKDGERHGFGSYYYRDGMLCYAGFWNKGEKNGLGVSFRHDDQALHVSNWQNNQPIGFVSLFDSDGNFKFGGKMTDGKKDGVGVSYDNDEGTVFVGKWKDGEYTGYGSVFDENGILMYSGMWKDGKRHGTGTSFDKNGEILFFGEWRDGEEYKGVLFKHVEP